MMDDYINVAIAFSGRCGVAKTPAICKVEFQPTARDWVVTCADSAFKQSRHASQTDAVWAARQLAKDMRPAIIQVYREDGTLDSEHPYR